jgi:hypothetical protein
MSDDKPSGGVIGQQILADTFLPIHQHVLHLHARADGQFAVLHVMVDGRIERLVGKRIDIQSFTFATEDQLGNVASGDAIAAGCQATPIEPARPRYAEAIRETGHMQHSWDFHACESCSSEAGRPKGCRFAPEAANGAGDQFPGSDQP